MAGRKEANEKRGAALEDPVSSAQIFEVNVDLRPENASGKTERRMTIRAHSVNELLENHKKVKLDKPDPTDPSDTPDS